MLEKWRTCFIGVGLLHRSVCLCTKKTRTLFQPQSSTAVDFRFLFADENPCVNAFFRLLWISNNSSVTLVSSSEIDLTCSSSAPINAFAAWASNISFLLKALSNRCRPSLIKHCAFFWSFWRLFCLDSQWCSSSISVFDSSSTVAKTSLSLSIWLAAAFCNDCS